MELNDFECGLFRDLSFFADDTTAFAGLEMRPASLCSWKAMSMMNLKLIEEDAEVSVEQETREIAVYLWLHSAPLHEVCAALWDGSWRGVWESAAEPAPHVVAAFRAWWARVLLMVRASAVRIRPRPKVPGDKTPRDLLPPEELAAKVGHIAAFTGAPLKHVKWHLFIGEALQHYHTAMRWHGAWTVRPGAEVKAEDCEDLMPDFLKTPAPDIDTAPPS